MSHRAGLEVCNQGISRAMFHVRFWVEPFLGLVQLQFLAPSLAASGPILCLCCHLALSSRVSIFPCPSSRRKPVTKSSPFPGIHTSARLHLQRLHPRSWVRKETHLWVGTQLVCQEQSMHFYIQLFLVLISSHPLVGPGDTTVCTDEQRTLKLPGPLQ